MHLVNFADSQDKISSMALGCLPFGTQLDIDQSFVLLDYYVSQGGNFLDTANNYSFWESNGQGGESERVLGDWFRARKNRHEIFLATKMGAFPRVTRKEFFDYAGNPWADLTEGLSAKTIFAAVDGSLQRLGTDYIDLYYAHVDDRRTDMAETLEALNTLVTSGKVRHIGCSNFKVWRTAQARALSRAHGWAQYKAVQMFHTYFQSEKGATTGMADQMGDEIFDYVRSGNQVSLLGYTPLLWGSYARPEKYHGNDRLRHFVRPQNELRRRRLEGVAKATGRSVAEVIYAWMLQNDPQVLPLVAVSQLEHLKVNLKADELRLEVEQLSLLNETLD